MGSRPIVVADRSLTTMRVSLVPVLAGLALSLAVSGAGLTPARGQAPASATVADTVAATVAAAGARRASASTAHERAARRVLARAERLLAPRSEDPGPVDPRRRAGRPPGRATQHGDLTPVLHALFLARRYLSAADRRTAQQILARPTDGAGDPYGDGYITASRELCGVHVCIHWVPRSYDKPRSARWVRVTLRVMEHTWRYEIDRLGYHAPLTDGTRGGDSRFDVYLADVGSKGYYGYCAAEAYAPHNRHRASGYCVLDNDFARWQFQAKPLNSLRVTAAHEFFHAIQYGYRVDQDRWLAEATATWMEDQVADGVNDNRQFLPAGQLGRPGQPLDTFAVDRFNEYGNWIFFAYLSQRFGQRIVRSIWRLSAAAPRGPQLDSMDAIREALRRRGHRFASVYAEFAAATQTPRASLPEGRAYTPAPVVAVRRLGPARRTTGRTMLTLAHLTSQTLRYRPTSTRPGARLRVTVRLPAALGSPVARLTLRTRSGVVRSLPVRVDASGHGSLTAPFDARRIAWVALTVANASTRFACGHTTAWTCQGVPLDDAERFVVAARVVRG